LDFGGNRDAGAPYSSIQLIETVFGQTDPTADFTFWQGKQSSKNIKMQ